MSNCDGFLILWITQLITVIFMFLHLPATCFLRLISLIAHPTLVQRCVMGFIIFEASVSDYAVTGNGAGTGSLLHWTPHWSEKEQVQSRCNYLQLIKALWRNLPENKGSRWLTANRNTRKTEFKVNLKVSIDGLGLNSQLSVSAKTVLTSSNIMDENSFTDPKKVVPAHSMLENADKDMDAVLSPYSVTSFDLLTESNIIMMPQIDSFSRFSI
ncbi:hypothetical protein OIU84_026614 [Salix udensis]|uniref:Uncharacterized protein n=1 Tax=Salix udensis TaxID=889485 RepID=A0AAD6KM89_9ROSI|nr:hypothetical protein OIU84_026614 [Salix udensis]